MDDYTKLYLLTPFFCSLNFLPIDIQEITIAGQK